MIPLNHLSLIQDSMTGRRAIGVSFIDPFVHMPLGIALTGFDDWEELPEIAEKLRDEVMRIYHNKAGLDTNVPNLGTNVPKMGTTEIPDNIRRAFEEDDGYSGDNREGQEE